MIYAVTFNPALDINATTLTLKTNEKNYVCNELHMAGGNGINAGIIAHRLGSRALLTGFLGGSNGNELRKILKREKVKSDFTVIKNNTRMNITISNMEDHLQTRLSFPGPSIRKREIHEFEKSLSTAKKTDLIIFGGSLPGNLSPQKVAKMAKKFNKKSVRVLVDMPSSSLQVLIKEKPFFIKPNLLEFQELIGKKVKTLKSVIAEAEKLLKYVNFICVSSVEGGAVVVSKEEIWFGKIPKIKINSTVGAGDSMVGGMASVWHRNPNASLDDVLRQGLAASCATLAEKGMTLGNKENIHKFGPQISLVCLKKKQNKKNGIKISGGAV